LARLPAAGLAGSRRPALLRPDAAQPVLPHGDGLPRPGRAPAPAGARCAARGRPAPAGVAAGPLPLVHPDLQPLQLHVRRDARVWAHNPSLLPFALAPLILLQRSLAVPALQAEARVDPKTGLFNARYFAAELADELGRAARFDRPMSLIMADLDLLRDINN